MKTAPASPLSSERGSLLIVALILCAVIGIALASYIHLGRNALTLSNRSLYHNAAMNLAEQGLEEAMFAINQAVTDPAYVWDATHWTLSGGNAQGLWGNVSVGEQKATATYRVYISGYNSSAPVILSRATVTLGGTNAAPIEKWIRVILAGSSRYANGLVAKNSILFKGNNVTVDSFHSTRNNDGTLRASPVSYDPMYRRDNGSVGSISVSNDAVLVKQADVWGYVSTNKVDPTLSVGNNGSILGADSVYDANTWTKKTVDPERVSTSFSASFEPDPQPTPGVASIGAVTTPQTLGSGGTHTIVCSSISLSGNSQVVTISGHVTLLVTAAAGTQAIQIAGNHSGITILPNSSLKLYTEGNIDLTGQGVINQTGQAKNFEIVGTRTSPTQDVKIAGGGSFVGTIYAPNADVTIHGNGAMTGSIVANNITMTGEAEFHYDEALGEPDGTAPYRVTKWEELTTATSRAAVASYLNF